MFIEKIEHKINSTKQLIFIFIAIIYLLCINTTYVGQYEDEVINILASKTLISEADFAINTAVGKRYSVQNPPGLALLLTPLTFFSIKILFIYKIFILFFSLASVFLLMKILEYKDFFTEWYIWILISLSPLIIKYSTVVINETIYLCFSLLAILLITNKAHWWIIGILTSFCYILNNIAVALIIVVFITYLLTKDYKQFIKYFLLSIIVIIANTLWRLKYENVNIIQNIKTLANLPETINYFVNVIIKNIFFIGDSVFTKALYISNTKIFYLTSVLGLAILILALILRLKKVGLTLIDLYFVIYITLLITTKNLNEICLLPVIPFIILYVTNILTILIPPRIILVKYVTIVILFLLFIVKDVNTVIPSITGESRQKTFPKETISWVLNNTKKETKVLGNLMFKLYTDRQTFLPPGQDYRYSDDFYYYVCSQDIEYIYVTLAERVTITSVGADVSQRYWLNIRDNFLKQYQRYNLLYVNDEEKTRVYYVDPAKKMQYLQAYNYYVQTVLLYQKGDLSSAIKNIETSIKISDFYPKAYTLLANLTAETGKDNIAIEWLKKSLDQDKEYPYTHATLGVIYKRMKQKDLARQEWQTAVIQAKNSGDTGLAEKMSKDLEDLDFYK